MDQLSQNSRTKPAEALLLPRIAVRKVSEITLVDPPAFSSPIQLESGSFIPVYVANREGHQYSRATPYHATGDITGICTLMFEDRLPTWSSGLKSIRYSLRSSHEDRYSLSQASELSTRLVKEMHEAMLALEQCRVAKHVGRHDFRTKLSTPIALLAKCAAVFHLLLQYDRKLYTDSDLTSAAISAQLRVAMFSRSIPQNYSGGSWIASLFKEIRDPELHCNNRDGMILLVAKELLTAFDQINPRADIAAALECLEAIAYQAEQLPEFKDRPDWNKRTAKIELLQKLSLKMSDRRRYLTAIANR